MAFKAWCRERAKKRGEFAGESVSAAAEFVALSSGVQEDWAPEEVISYLRRTGTRSFIVHGVMDARDEFLTARKVQQRRKKSKSARVARRKNRNGKA